MATMSSLARLSAVSLGSAVLSLGVVQPSQAATLFSDSFNSENFGLDYNSFAQWTVSEGTVDVIGKSPTISFFELYDGNRYGKYVDLDGSSENAGLLSTKATFGPGKYILKFALGESKRRGLGTPPDLSNTVRVALGDWFTEITLPTTVNVGESGAGIAPLALNEYVFEAITTTGGSLSFANAGGDNVGAILDNVEVAAVPTPALLPGLIGLGVAALRRKNDETAEENA